VDVALALVAYGNSLFKRGLFLFFFTIKEEGRKDSYIFNLVGLRQLRQRFLYSLRSNILFILLFFFFLYFLFIKKS